MKHVELEPCRLQKVLGLPCDGRGAGQHRPGTQQESASQGLLEGIAAAAEAGGPVANSAGRILPTSERLLPRQVAEIVGLALTASSRIASEWQRCMLLQVAPCKRHLPYSTPIATCLQLVSMDEKQLQSCPGSRQWVPGPDRILQIPGVLRLQGSGLRSKYD